jgi:uncharacterized protein
VAITFSGEFSTPRTPDEVYDLLSDATKFGPLLPDFESMTVQDATHFTVKLRVAVGNIRGSAEIKMELSQAVRPTRAQYQGRGVAMGSQISIRTSFDLAPVAEGTRIAWTGEASIAGKLASLAGGLLEPVSRKNIERLIDGLQRALAHPATVIGVVPDEVVAPGELAAPEPAQEEPGPSEPATPSERSPKREGE